MYLRCILCLFCFLIAGCADMTRKLDIAIYGSEEEADAAHATYLSNEFKRNEKKSKKLAEETKAFIRDERKRNRLYPCTVDTSLREVAKIRSKEIVTQYSATRPNGLHSFSLYQEFDKLTDVRPVRELRAKGPKTPREVVNYWLSRKEDKKVLFGPRIHQMEVGLSIVGSTYYWVLVSYE